MNVNPFSYLIEKLMSKVSKSGDTMSGDLGVDAQNGSAGVEGFSTVTIGNNTPYTQNKNSTGKLTLFSSTGNVCNIYPDAVTEDRSVWLPNKNGAIALTSDLPTFSEVNKDIAPSEDVYILNMPIGYIPLCIRCYDPQYSLYYDYSSIAHEGLQVIYYSDMIRLINGTSRSYKVIVTYTK